MTGHLLPGPATCADEDVAVFQQLVHRMPSVAVLQAAISKTVGRPRSITVEALLVGLLLVAFYDHTANLKGAATWLHSKISDNARDLLGLTTAAPRRADAFYRSYVRLFHAVAEQLDASAFVVTCGLQVRDEPRKRRILARGEQLARHQRCVEFMGDLLETAVRTLPPEVLARWKGDVGLDATPVGTFGRGRNSRGSFWPSDPDAAMYTRDPDNTEEDYKQKKHIFGYEMSLAFMEDPWTDDERQFPSLVVGMVVHKPGHAPGPNGARVLAGIQRRQHPAGLVGADRAYNGSKPEGFQLPAQQLGYGMVFDYRIDQLGKVAEAEGAIQVEGNWYCPSMPEALIAATHDYRAGTIDEATYRARIVTRTAYLLRPKQSADKDGRRAFICPGRGTGSQHAGRTVNCGITGLQPKVTLPTVIPVGRPTTELPALCANSRSVTINPVDGAKHAQPLQYQSARWTRAYGRLRNASEGGHSRLKAATAASLHDSRNRRVRGLAAQSIQLAVLLAASNVRNVSNWLAKATSDDGTVTTTPRRRRRPSLRDFTTPPNDDIAA